MGFPATSRFVALSSELLAQGYGVRFRASGGSMRPAVCDGDVVTVAPAAGRSLAPGNVILYRSSDRLIAHRVVRIAAEGVLLRGDAMPACDAPVSRAQVLGELVAVQRPDAQSGLSRVSTLARRLLRRPLETAEVAGVIVRGRGRMMVYPCRHARMTTHVRRLASALVWASLAAGLAFPAATSAAGPDDPPGSKTANRPGGARAMSSRTGVGIGPHATAIIGSAWDADNSPIEFASLRLRDVIDGKVEATAKADARGEFTFENVPGGSYVVELLSDSGKVETMGHVFTIAPGETVATFVRLPAKVPSWTAFFTNTAGAAALAAASQGLAAIAPLPLCTSPPCHN